jgi:hypothetical protein
MAGNNTNKQHACYRPDLSAFNPEFSHHQSRAQNQKKVKNGMQLKKRQYRLSHHYKAFPVPK